MFIKTIVIALLAISSALFTQPEQATERNPAYFSDLDKAFPSLFGGANPGSYAQLQGMAE